MEPLLEIDVSVEADVFSARQFGRVVAAAVGLDEQDQTRMATVVSELGRDLIGCGGGRVAFGLERGHPGHVVTRVTVPAPLGQSSALPMGVEAAGRLLGRGSVSETVEAGALEVSVQRALGPQRLFTAEEVTALRDDLRSRLRSSPLDELRAQNEQLIDALERVRSKQDELVALNTELEATNRGVMAMYGQLTDEMEATNRGVVALYAELESKSEQLREASEAKSRFLANVSHELRTPVNSILGITALLTDDPARTLSEDQRYEVKLVSASAVDLLSLVNELLDLAKAESGRLDPLVERVSVSALCRDVRAALAPLAAEGVALAFEDHSEGIDEVDTDSALLSRVVRNLVTNVLKFTETGSVRICQKPSPSQQHVEIAVVDTGIGIDPAHHAAIFEEFFQVRGHLQVKAKGTGLGLPYARRVVEALGGSLSLVSAEGEGSTFTVQLPVHWHLANIDEGPVPDATARVGTVLVVDDDEGFRRVLRGMLQGAADRVVEAADGLEAMDFVRNRSTPDVVFLDLRMPGADGYQVLSFLEGAGLGDIPVFVTTSMDLPLLDMPTLAGARAVLSKGSITPRMIRSLIVGTATGVGRVGG